MDERPSKLSERFGPLVGRALLHLAGLAILAVAWLSGRAMLIVSRGHAGHEPALAYLLALLTFLLASAGAALAALGRRLFARIIVAEPWLPHVPAGFANTKRWRDD